MAAALLWGSGERCQAAGLGCILGEGGWGCRSPRSRCEQLQAPASQGGGDGGQRERGRDLERLDPATPRSNAGAVAGTAPREGSSAVAAGGAGVSPHPAGRRDRGGEVSPKLAPAGEECRGDRRSWQKRKFLMQ